ncbi:MAG: DNA gyrase C-terminal beta-propeller domain-containing protein, partial [Pseudomonadota bacterium]
GKVAASFPVENADEIMLVTNGGQLIRTPVHDIRVAGRNTQGVKIITTREDEHVVSVEHVPEGEGEEPEESGTEES